jgi:hypothetical protein
VKFHRIADATCRSRAEDLADITLCRGEIYALNMLGAIECGCRKKAE